MKQVDYINRFRLNGNWNYQLFGDEYYLNGDYAYQLLFPLENRHYKMVGVDDQRRTLLLIDVNDPKSYQFD